MARIDVLSEDELRRVLAELPGWAIVEGELVREFRFAGFLEAIRFVNGVAGVAEEAGHHPDLDIRYSRVKVALTTHDAGGITAKDFGLASRIMQVIEKQLLTLS